MEVLTLRNLRITSIGAHFALEIFPPFFRRSWNPSNEAKAVDGIRVVSPWRFHAGCRLTSRYSHRKLTWQLKKITFFADVFPIEDGDFPMSCYVFVFVGCLFFG